MDLCRLAGKPSVAVIAELVEDGETVDGTPELKGNIGMMRRDACLKFGRRWGLKVCTIEDLVVYLNKTKGSSRPLVNGKH